jgi:hypothetical protein
VTEQVFIDYEVRSTAPLGEVGAWAYAEADSTELACATWRRNQEGPYHVWVPFLDVSDRRDGSILHRGTDIPKPLLEAIQDKCEFIAHNAEFEAAMTEFGLGLPVLDWYDTQAMCAYFQFPQSLGEASIALKIGEKDTEGQQVMMTICVPGASGALTDPMVFMVDRLVDYNIVDVKQTEKIYNELRKWMPQSEVDVWKEHLAINRRGIPIDLPLVQAMQAMRKHQSFGNILPKSWDSDRWTLEPRYIRPWLAARGIHFEEDESFDKKAVDRTLKMPGLTEEVRLVLQARSDEAKASLTKLPRLLQAVNADGRIRGQHRYYKFTGRWAGWGVQVQNFAKPPDKRIKQLVAIEAIMTRDPVKCKEVGQGSVANTLVTALRGTIVSSPGKTLVVSDYSNVEARGVLWQAGDKEHLAVWASGQDMYALMASRLYNREILKGRDDKERDIGKRTILGCNFQQGEDRFDEECHNNGINLRALGLTSEKIITTFRAEFRSLADYDTGLWAKLNNAIIECIENRTRVFTSQVEFRWRNGNVYCRLPSGRDLIWRGCQVRMEKRTSKRTGREYWSKQFVTINPYQPKFYKNGKRVPEKNLIEYYHGGKIADETTQAICSDLLRDAMMRVKTEGQHLDMKVIFHTHDELVSEVPDEHAEAAMHLQEKIMKEGPKWAIGFPINAESFITKRYCK